MLQGSERLTAPLDRFSFFLFFLIANTSLSFYSCSIWNQYFQCVVNEKRPEKLIRASSFTVGSGLLILQTLQWSGTLQSEEKGRVQLKVYWSWCRDTFRSSRYRWNRETRDVSQGFLWCFVSFLVYDSWGDGATVRKASRLKDKERWRWEQSCFGATDGKHAKNMTSWCFNTDLLCVLSVLSLHNERNLLCLREDDGKKDLGSSLKVCVCALLMGSHHHKPIYWLLTFKLPRLFSLQ